VSATALKLEEAKLLGILYNKSLSFASLLGQMPNLQGASEMSEKDLALMYSGSF
jgi:hypothetical protein